MRSARPRQKTALQIAAQITLGANRLTLCATCNRRISLQVRIGGSHIVLIVRYDAIAVVFSGNVAVNLYDVAHVAGVGWNLFSLTAGHIRTDGLGPEVGEMCNFSFDGRLRLERDGSGFSSFN